MKSLQSRLHLGLLGSLVILAMLVGWLVNSSITQIATQMMETRLEHDGEALLASLQQDSNGKLSFKSLQLGPVYKRVFSGHYFLIKTTNLHIRSHSLWDQTLKQPQLKLGQTLVEIVDGPNKQKLLQWSSQFKRFKQVITISIAEDTSVIISALKKFNLYFAISALIILILLLLIQGVIVKRSLSPLHNIKDELQALSEGEITTLSKQVPTELHPLIDEVNRLLQLLKEQLKRSRNSTGNLAHSLKHPLNLLMQIAESEEASMSYQIRNELQINTRQINQLMERELKRAKLAGSGIPGQLFSPKEELSGLIDVLKRVYHDKSLSIEVATDKALEFKADKNDMMELLGNLLDNACKWSTNKVSCKLSKGQQFGLIIQVDDNGSGCNSDQLSSLTLRGVRADETISGTGLGLSIVNDIVELYFGTIEFKQSSMGGLCVIVKLR